MTPTRKWAKARRRQIRERIIYGILALILAWLLVSFVNVNQAHNSGTEVWEWNAFEIIFAQDFQAETVYVICDVREIMGEDYVIEMPDGSLHIYAITDEPEQASEVCFATENQEDYTTYRIVAAR